MADIGYSSSFKKCRYRFTKTTGTYIGGFKTVGIGHLGLLSHLLGSDRKRHNSPIWSIPTVFRPIAVFALVCFSGRTSILAMVA